MYEEPKDVAAKMLGCDNAQLHYQFVDYLAQIEALVRSGGGELLSRQAIAVAIVNWQLITGNAARSE